MSRSEGTARGRPAKLSTPSGRGLLARPRLFARIEEAGMAGRPMWVVAPAGSGKTGLLASYCQTYQRTPIWYRFDEGDVDVGNFLHYFGRAIEHEHLPAGVGIEVRDSSLAKTPDAQRAYVRELLSNLAEGMIIVLDDYHIVPADSAMHALFAAMLEEVQPGLTLCIATRTPPQGVLARSYVNSLLIDRDELRLAREEALAIAKQIGIEDGHVVDKVLTLSQGWASGLILLLRGAKAMRSLAASVESPGLVSDFLAAEVFPQLTQTERSVLTHCAFLPVVTAEAAVRLTRHEDAGSVLRSLRDRQVFVDPLRDNDAYVFHPLLRTFHIAEAERALSAKEFMALKVSCAEIMEETGEDAELPALLAGLQLWERLAGFVERNASRLITQGRAIMVENCIRRLPAEALERFPWCRYWLGICLVPRDMEAAHAQFDAARSRMLETGDDSGAHDASRAALDALFWQWGNKSADSTSVWGKGITAVFGRAQRLVPNFRGLLFGGFAMLTADPAHAITRGLIKQAETLYRESTSAALRTQAATMLVAAYNIQGDHSQASAITAEAAHLGDRDDVPVPIRLYWLTGVSMQHWYIDGQGPAAIEVAERGLALVRQTGAVMFEHFLIAMKGSAHLCNGDVAAAEETYRELCRVSKGERPMERARECFLLGAIHLRRGEVGPACEALALSLALIERLPLFLVFVVQHRLALIRGLLAAHRHAEALEHIAKARAAADRAQSPWFRWQVLLAQAEALLAVGRESEADDALATALVLGRVKGMLAIPLISPERLAALLDRALMSGVEPDFVRKLGVRHRVRPLQSESDRWPWPVRVYALGRFELIVDDVVVRFRKAPKRPLELLQALIAHGGTDVPSSVLQDALWPDAEGDAAEKAFEITLLRLRRLLRDDAVVNLEQRKLTLNPALCWVDVQALERLLGRVETQLNRPLPLSKHPLSDLAQRLLALYAGGFLIHEADQPWIRAARFKLQQRVSRTAKRLASELRSQGHANFAESLCAQLAERDLRVSDPVSQ